MTPTERSRAAGRPAARRADALPWAKTACILCECNCGLEVQVEDGHLRRIRGDKDHPSSAGYTCEKPLRLERYQSGRHRLDTPLRRRPDGTFEPIDWDTAIAEIAERLESVRDRFGGETIFMYGGGGQGNHLGGTYGRALGQFLGVRYQANALSQEKSGELWLDGLMFGNHTKGDFEHTDVAVFIGKNPWQSHGLARSRVALKELAGSDARTVIVIDPRRSETAELADIHLQVRPGTDLWCLAALLGVIVQEDLVDRGFLAEHVTGVAPVLAALGEIDIAACAAACGVDEGLLRTAARTFATARCAATYEDLGIQMGRNSTVVSYLNKLLWVLTGNFAKPGAMHVHSWLAPLSGRWHAIPTTDAPRLARLRAAVGRVALRAGAPVVPRVFAAASRSRPTRRLADGAAALALRAFYGPISVDIARGLADRLTFADAPAVSPVTGSRIVNGLLPGAVITEEILTDHPSRFRAMWVDSSNPVHSLPDSARMREALAALELVVVIDVAMTETAQCADYVLPASSQFEKCECTFFNLEFPVNTFQLRQPVTPPLAGTWAEPEIYAALLRRLGAVPAPVIERLRAAAGLSPRAFGLAFFSLLEAEPALVGLAPHLLYEALGPRLPEGMGGAAVLWGLAQLCAVSQPDAVARAGFGARGFDQGQQLYEAILARPQGVAFTVDRYDDAWGYLARPDATIDAHVAELLDDLPGHLAASASTATPEFPFVLSAGERRSFTANTIYRDPGWRKRDAHGALRMSGDDAHRLGAVDGTEVLVTTATGAARAVVEVSGMMAPGHVSLPNGYGLHHTDEAGTESVVGVAPNDLTSRAHRDPYVGTPLHKHVPARIEVVDPAPALSPWGRTEGRR